MLSIAYRTAERRFENAVAAVNNAVSTAITTILSGADAQSSTFVSSMAAVQVLAETVAEGATDELSEAVARVRDQHAQGLSAEAQRKLDQVVQRVLEASQAFGQMVEIEMQEQGRK